MVIFKYFNQLNERQQQQFKQLYKLYEEWNSQINVVSRKHFENFIEQHVLHSLAIAKTVTFLPNQRIIDVGTGGGFPGIPLAILFPETYFTLCDSIGKKIKVVTAVAEALELSNVEAVNARSEQINDKYDAMVSRAVTRFTPFMQMTKHLLKTESMGIFYLKGGDLDEEISELKNEYPKKNIILHPIKNMFEEEFFETKYVVEVG